MVPLSKFTLPSEDGVPGRRTQSDEPRWTHVLLMSARLPATLMRPPQVTASEFTPASETLGATVNISPS